MKDIFDKASIKIRKSKLLKIFVLSGILLSHNKFNNDLIAEEAPLASIETTIKNPEINISCDEKDKDTAKILKNLIYDIEDDNETSQFIIKSLEKNNTVLEIVNENSSYNGAYGIGKNKIEIPRNIINNTTKSKENLTKFKRMIIHESTHMLQDKKGIFTDAKQLSPLDCSIIYTIAEIDAICKSYIVTSENSWNTNSAFDCFSCMISCLDSYTKQGFYIGKINNLKNSNIKIEDIVKKFNNEGFDDYNDTNKLISTVKDKINSNLMKKLISENEEYIKKAQEQKIIALTNFEKE